jgi:gamma-glutamyl-gamma-aminobutyrate hydrolase PuuD
LTARPIAVITQRGTSAGPDRAVHDALDRRWHPVADRWGLCLVPLPNALVHACDLLDMHRVALVILSGGGDLSAAPGAQSPDPERELVEALCLRHARSHGIGVLGVCRGAQALWVDAGGRLEPTAGHDRGTHPVTPTTAGVAAGLHAGTVNTFHSYRLDGTPSARVDVLAHAADGSVEAFALRSGYELGVLWHPERPENTVFLDRIMTDHLRSTTCTP